MCGYMTGGPMTALEYMYDKPALKKFFEGIDEADIAQLELVHYATGLTIIHKDSSAEYIYIIVNGICGTFRELVNGEQFCTYKISTLDVIGMSEILEALQVSRYAEVRTLTDVSAFKIKKEYLKGWMQKYPDFYNKLVMGIINRLHNTLSKHVECKMYNAHTNVVSYLIYSYDLYCHNYEDDHCDAVKINETREMIRDFLGMSVRSINSSVEKLKTLDMVSVKRGKIYMTKGQYDKMVDYRYDLLL